jgi:hypothetical protein
MSFNKIYSADKVPKTDEIWNYSNPNKVYKLGRELGITVYRSNKPKKKYMVIDDNEKWIHFGLLPYEDYTKHNDEERRNKFLKRNKKWEDKPIYSPAFLSYHLLW